MYKDCNTGRREWEAKRPEMLDNGLFKIEPTTGFEPATYALRMISPKINNLFCYSILEKFLFSSCNIFVINLLQNKNMYNHMVI